MFKSPTYRFLAGDFNNDLGADSNSGPVLGPDVYLNLRFPGGCYIWPRAHA